MWFTKSSPTPTVITGPLQAPVGGSNTTTPPVLGFTTQTIVSGTVPPINTASGTLLGDVNNGLHYGFNLDLGGWLDPERTVGVEFGYFLLPSQSSTNNAGGPGIAAIPYVDALTGKGTSYTLNQPTTTSTRTVILRFLGGTVASATETVKDTFNGGAAFSSSSTLQERMPMASGEWLTDL
jgi:hypothetical protein